MEYIKTFVQTIQNMQFTDMLDIIIVAVLIYKLLPLLRSTGTTRIATVVGSVVLIAWLTGVFKLHTLSWILNQFLAVGIIAVVVIFYNATKVFLKEIKLFQSLLPFEFISGLVLAVCLIYKIPEKTLQNIVLTIVAAVVGGLITLLGVAWTIKSNYKDKRNDDRKKNIPYIAMGALDTTGHAGTKIKIEEHGYFLSAHMLSDTIFIFKGVLRDNQFVKAEHLIAPKSDFSVQMNIQDYDEVYLIGSDVLGNHYSFALSCYIRENSKTKMVASIGLPQESDCIEMLWV